MLSDLYPQFVLEATALLRRVQGWLASASVNPPDEIEPAVRDVHSIKGAASMVGAAAAANCAGKLQELIAQFSTGAAPSPEKLDAALALCGELAAALEQGTGDSGDVRGADGESLLDGETFQPDESGLWEALQSAVPGIPQFLLESLTEFQCDETLRLLRQHLRLWLVWVDTTAERFESDSDKGAAYLKRHGNVISRSIGAGAEPSHEYVVTFLTAAVDEPTPPGDSDFPFRVKELPVSFIPETASESSSGAVPQPVSSPASLVVDQPDPELLDIFLATSDNLLLELTDSIAAAERSPDSTDALDALFRAGHSLKGAGGSFGFPIASRLGKEMESVLDKVRRRKLELNQNVVDVLYACVDALAGIIGQARTGALDQDAPLPVIAALRRLGPGEPSGDAHVKSATSAATALPGLIPSAGFGTSIHLPIEAADRLLDLGRDAWLASETAAFVAPLEGEVRDSIERTRFTILTLVDAILAMRMQPVGHILKAYPRLIRDVCHAHNKRVKLLISGADVQMDRLLLEAISDPLVHLVRNALDHGIETPEERVAAGKPGEGTLTINVSADRAVVLIEIKDDGRGIDTAGLRQKAVAEGKITQEAADTLNEAQSLDLVFLPGVTTKDAVSDLSGRGVGMDVVRVNIEQVRGRVQVDTALGHGTTIRLHLPLTTAVLRVVLLRAAGMTLCVPTTAVERVVAVGPGATTVELGAKNEATEIVPIVPVSRYLTEAQANIRGHEAVVVRDRGKVIALLVDHVDDERSVLVTDLGGLISRTPWVGACTLLANGDIAPILDTGAILAAFDAQAQAAPATAGNASEVLVSGPRTVLAVDDSSTMRQLMRNILELSGYRVLLAANTREALEILQHSTPDIVLADVAMPGMDGLTLVREIKRQFPRLPVAIISGRDQESDRQAGLQAGADAYVLKGATDRRGLIATVARLIGGEMPA